MSGPSGSFLAGADIEHELKFVGPSGALRSFTEPYQLQLLFSALEALPIPTIAVLNGTTLGGGLELALACDYRVADRTLCKQIGLPEVKLGLLPGAGGCCRLPRQVGFRNSLDLILTGQPVTASKALNIGLVDCLFESTQSILEGGGGGEHPRSYKYQWLSCILDSVEKGRLGGKPLALEYGNGTDAVEMGMGNGRDAISEEELWEKLGSSPGQVEAKARRKYPREAGVLGSTADYLADFAVYVVAVFQTWRKVGSVMPAPYACLQTTLQCYHTPGWIQAMMVNATGFSGLASTAEAKGLMGLFLLSRRLKKFALTYGVGFADTPVKFDAGGALVVVVVTSEWTRHPIAFVQGLLYAGHTVAMVVVSGELDSDRLVEQVKQHFGYSLKKGHLSMEEVEGKMKRLHYFQSELPSKMVDGLSSVVLVNATGEDTYVAKVESIVSMVASKKLKVCVLHLAPTVSTIPGLLLNLGDPVRNNTLAVEVSTCNGPDDTAQVSDEDVRTAAAFCVSFGKIPVVTPSSSFSSLGVSGFVSVYHWALATRLVATHNLSPAWLDKCLVKAGFTKGPFAVMEELGKDDLYLTKMATVGGQLGIWCKALKSYLAGRSRPTGKKAKLDPGKLADLFIFNALNAALILKQRSPLLPASALDFLCVSGPVQFPPAEGGPLNYLIRNGRERIAERLEQLCHSSVLAEEAGKLATMLKQSEVSSEEVLGEGQPKDVSSEFSKKRSQLCLLTASELQAIGPCAGLRHKETLIQPLPFHLPTLLLLLLVMVIVVGTGVSTLLWGAAVIVVAVGPAWAAAVGLIAATAAAVLLNRKRSRRRNNH
eukprot:Em0009g1029a